MNVFERIVAAMETQPGVPDQPMIDNTHLKAHRTAASLAEKEPLRTVSAAPETA